MPNWRLNTLEGLYNAGAAYPFQKSYQILADYAVSGRFAISACKNHVCYSTAWAIWEKFIAIRDCQAWGSGRPPKKMEPFMAAYMEAVIFMDPFLYLKEIQHRLRPELNLLPHEVPSVPVICRTLHDLNLSKHKSTKAPQEPFTPYKEVSCQGLNWSETCEKNSQRFQWLDTTKEWSTPTQLPAASMPLHLQMQLNTTSCLTYRGTLLFSSTMCPYMTMLLCKIFCRART